MEVATAVVNKSFIAAPLGQKRARTAGGCLALAIAVVCATSTTLTPSDYHDVPRLAVANDCERLCEFAARSLETPAAASKAVTEHSRTTLAKDVSEMPSATPKDRVVEAKDAAVAIPPTVPPLAARQPETTVAIADEPITSRPIADRFDFAGTPIHSMLAEFNAGPFEKQFAALPVSELNPLPAAQLASVQFAGPELKALPPQVQLTASLDQPGLRASKAPQVAGWRLIRTIEIEEITEGADLATVAMPMLPVQKPDVPPSYRTETPRQVPQAKISRRVRQRSAPAPAAKKTSATAPKTNTGRSWKNQALFRDN